MEVPIAGLSAIRSIIRFDNIFKLDLIKPSQHALTWSKDVGIILYKIKMLSSKVCWFQITHFMMVVLWGKKFNICHNQTVSMAFKILWKKKKCYFCRYFHAQLRAQYISLEVYMKLNVFFWQWFTGKQLLIVEWAFWLANWIWGFRVFHELWRAKQEQMCIAKNQKMKQMKQNTTKQSTIGIKKETKNKYNEKNGSMNHIIKFS